MAPEDNRSWPHLEADGTIFLILWEVPCKRSEEDLCGGGSGESW